MIPGLAGVILVFVGTMITSLGVVRERQSGTLEQLAVMPLRPRDVFLGKVAPYFAVAAVDLAIALDRAVTLAFRNASSPTTPVGPLWVLEAARDIATSLGSIIVLGLTLFTMVGYLLLARERAAAYLMLGAVLGGVALNDILKFVFARPRPDFATPGVEVFTSSFPSGHAALSAITYLTLGAIFSARTHPSVRIRIYFVLVAAIVTFLVGISRVYLGVHYPTDVLAGWCIGTAWAMGCWALMTRLRRRDAHD